MRSGLRPLFSKFITDKILQSISVCLFLLNLHIFYSFYRRPIIYYISLLQLKL